MNPNLYELFRSRFPAEPDDAAIKTADGASYSFADLDAATARVARLLQNKGIATGDRVAIQAPKSPQSLFLYLACLRAGVVCLPMNTAYTEPEVAYILRDAEPKLFVCDPTAEAQMGMAAMKAANAITLTLGEDGEGSLSAEAAAADADFPLAQLEADDLAAILYTSGTTGQPKGAMLSHANLSSNALTLHKAWAFEPGDVLLHALPIFHAHGLFVAAHLALLNASKMIFLPTFNAAQVATLMPQATVYMGVPTHYVRLLDEPGFDRESAKGMRLFVSGSAPLMEETFRDFESRIGHTILERYGMTETAMNTSNPYAGPRVPGSVGPPLAGVEARVCNDQGVVLDQGEVGVLEVRGPNVFKGYWRNPEKTKAEFRADGFFITGDLASFDEHGYVHIVGRAKDLIISGGFNVYPKEIETALVEMAGISDAAVIGVPHRDFGEGVMAVVVAGRDLQGSEQSIIDELRKELAAYKTPKKIVFVDEIPRNTMGKIQKNALREAYDDAFKQ